MVTPVVSRRTVAARVVVVDDHPILRDGVAKIVGEQPDMSVVGVAGCVRDGLDLIRQSRPDVAILDLSLGDESGLDIIKALRASGSDVACLVLSMHEEGAFADRCLRAGAMGYVMKDAATTELVAAVRAVLRGETWLSSAHASADDGQRPAVTSLTDRELEVLRLLGGGLKSSKIAERLGLSAKTVEAHRQNIKEKLGLGSSPELIVYAAKFAQGLPADASPDGDA